MAEEQTTFSFNSWRPYIASGLLIAVLITLPFTVPFMTGRSLDDKSFNLISSIAGVFCAFIFFRTRFRCPSLLEINSVLLIYKSAGQDRIEIPLRDIIAVEDKKTFLMVKLKTRKSYEILLGGLTKDEKALVLKLLGSSEPDGGNTI